MTELRLSDVTFAYDGEESPVVEHFSYEIDSGTISLVSGPSGCGKSTLFRLMAGLLPQYGGRVTSGCVMLENAEMEAIVPFERARRVAMLFQNPGRQFAMRTVREQFVFALENLQVEPDEIMKRTDEALAQFGLEDFRNRDLQELSGGEQQRIALALVCSLGSSVILLDEPFANVDPENRARLLQDLKELRDCRQKTILISDHDPSGYGGIADHWYHFTKNGFFEEDAGHLGGEAAEPVVTGTAKTPARLEWSGLGYSAGSRKLLSDSAFGLPTGQMGLLSGRNGCGKSTLFSCLCGLHEKSGRVLLDGRDSAGIKPVKWARDVGYVFQNSTDQFIRVSVEEEIEASRKNTMHRDYWSDGRIHEAVEALHLAGVMEHSVYQISGGQQKKLQMLVMLIMAPTVLLADEPFAGLDAQSLATVLKLMRRVTDDLNLSVLVISHQRAGVTGFMDYEVRIENGSLREVSA